MAGPFLDDLGHLKTLLKHPIKWSKTLDDSGGYLHP